MSGELQAIVRVCFGALGTFRVAAELPEDPVHDLRSCRDYRPQLASVDCFGGPTGTMTGQACDLFDADPRMAHQAHEGGP